MLAAGSVDHGPCPQALLLTCIGPHTPGAPTAFGSPLLSSFITALTRLAGTPYFAAAAEIAASHWSTPDHAPPRFAIPPPLTAPLGDCGAGAGACGCAL